MLCNTFIYFFKYVFVFIISLRIYQVSLQKSDYRIRNVYFSYENKCYLNVLLYIYEIGIAFFLCFKRMA